MDDISLSSVSANPAVDSLSDGSNDNYDGFSAFGTSVAQLGTEIAAAVSGVPAAPAVVYAPPPPGYPTSVTGSGKAILIVIILVIGVIALVGVFGSSK
jgi:hypothetical protein